MQTAVQPIHDRSREPRKRRRRPRILLVEDSEDIRLMLKGLLEMSGYEVREAVNGEQAIQMAPNLLPDAILMDLSLPRVDGLTATRLIRLMPRLRRVPIVVVTAHDTADFYAEAFASGADEYLNKPIDFGELELLLQQLVPSY